MKKRKGNKKKTCIFIGVLYNRNQKECIRKERVIALKIYIFDDSMEYAKHVAQCLNEYAAARALHYDIQLFTDDKELLAHAAQDGRIDLLFSDIDLGQQGKTGVDVVRAFQTLQPSCAVVYVTSYLNFATEVYETPHVYFVLKSELRRRLPAVMERVASRYRAPSRTLLHFKRKDSEIIIDPAEIQYCEHQGRQTQIVTNAETITVYQKIGELMDMLNPHDFVRCHNSYIVHLRYVTKFNRTAFTMGNGHAIPISRANYADTKQRFSDYLSREF